MVPREQIPWILDQPQDVLGIHEARYDKFALELILPERNDAIDQVFLEVIHRKLTRNLFKLQGELAGEVSRNLDAMLGIDPDAWVETNVWEMVSEAVFSAMTRILVGPSVCRNPRFRDDVSSFTKYFGISSIVVGRLLPKSLKPLFGQLLSSVTLWKQKRLLETWFDPLVKERFEKLAKSKEDANFSYDPPQDLVTWASDALMRSGNVVRCSPNALARRLALMVSNGHPSPITDFMHHLRIDRI